MTVSGHWGSSTSFDERHPSLGLFITFEGIDGSGKSTLAGSVYRKLAERLGTDRMVMTHEPGGWDGERLRETLIGETSERTDRDASFLADGLNTSNGSFGRG